MKNNLLLLSINKRGKTLNRRMPLGVLIDYRPRQKRRWRFMEMILGIKKD